MDIHTTCAYPTALRPCSLPVAEGGLCYRHAAARDFQDNPFSPAGDDGLCRVQTPAGQCGDVTRSGGMCRSHAYRKRKYGDPNGGREFHMPNGRRCSVQTPDGPCPDRSDRKGMCRRHFYANDRYGDPLAQQVGRYKRLGEQEVQKIRERYPAESRAALAQEFDVSVRSITNVVGNHCHVNVARPAPDAVLKGCPARYIDGGWCGARLAKGRHLCAGCFRYVDKTGKSPNGRKRPLGLHSPECLYRKEEGAPICGKHATGRSNRCINHRKD